MKIITEKKHGELQMIQGDEDILVIASR